MPIRPPWNAFLSISTLIVNATIENRVTYDDLMDKTVLKLLIFHFENSNVFLLPINNTILKFVKNLYTHT